MYLILDFMSQMLIGLGLVRVIGAGFESLFLIQWYMKGGKEKFALGYWSAFHILAAWIVVFTVFQYAPGVSTNVMMSLITFGVLVYALMFYMPAYKSEVLFMNRMGQEIEQKQQNEGTTMAMGIFRARKRSSVWCGIGIAVLLILRFFVEFHDPIGPLMVWFRNAAPWLYWALAIIAGLAFLYSAFIAVQVLIAFFRQKKARKDMENKIGRKLTDQEFVYLYLDMQKEKKGK